MKNLRHLCLGASLGILLVASACGGSGASGGSPTSPTSGSTTGPTAGSASLGFRFTADAGVRLTQEFQPSPLVVNGAVYLYLSGGSNSVLQTADGLTFTSVPASYPPGSSRSFVTLPDGRFRMYYFNPGSAQMLSALSSDGRNWTADAGIRMTLNVFAVPKVVAAPGGYRVYYTGGNGPILSAFSSDGLTFTADAGNRLTANSSFSWGDPAVIKTGSQWLMLVTDLPNNQSFSSIWLASSPDGLAWTLDSKPIITDSGGSPVDAAFLPISNGYRIYYGVVIGASAGAANPNTKILSGILSPG